MTIREASAEDLSSIVQLLKAALGDHSSVKSIEYWRWKHIENPFGQSPVLLAEENGKLIGVRAMMQWRWKEGSISYKSLRAVDTATLPQYQGKGIFKKLTLQMVENAKKEGFDFIFNTPNKISIIGYLKMGWVELGRIPVLMRPVFSMKRFDALLFEEKHKTLLQLNLMNAPKIFTTGKGMHTDVDPDWLSWRYQRCPVKKYICDQSNEDSNSLWLFASVRNHTWGIELRICSYLFSNTFSSSQLFKQSTKLAKSLGCNAVTIAGLQEVPSYQYLRFGFLPITKMSLKFTLRHLNSESLIIQMKQKSNWYLNSGDIELF
jgi:GNAT superfamily N-acetyltransferase